MYCVKKQMLMLLLALFFGIQQELSRTKANPIPFKR